MQENEDGKKTRHPDLKFRSTYCNWIFALSAIFYPFETGRMEKNGFIFFHDQFHIPLILINIARSKINGT